MTKHMEYLSEHLGLHIWMLNQKNSI